MYSFMLYSFSAFCFSQNQEADICFPRSVSAMPRRSKCCGCNNGFLFLVSAFLMQRYIFFSKSYNYLCVFCNFVTEFTNLIINSMLKQSFLLTFCLLLSAGAYAQETDSKTRTVTVPSWVANLSERIELHGYAQAGYTWKHQDDNHSNTFDVKRVLFWAKANVTDRWSFLFMHDFSSEVQEFYTDYRFSRGKEINVRFGQFKNSLSMQNPLSPTKLDLIDCYS